MSVRKARGVNRSLMNATNLQIESTWGLHEILLLPVLLYGSETMVWKEKDKSSI